MTDELSGLVIATVSTNGRKYLEIPPLNGIHDAGMIRFVVKIAPASPCLFGPRMEAGISRARGPVDEINRQKIKR